MATNITRSVNASSSTKSRLSSRSRSRNGFKHARCHKSHHSRGHRVRKLVFHGPPRCSYGLVGRKPCRSTAYKQYGNSSDSVRAHKPFGVKDSYQELERSICVLSPFGISGKDNLPRHRPLLSSDSSEDCLSETNGQGHEDTRSRDYRHGNQSEHTEREEIKTAGSQNRENEAPGQQRSLSEQLRVRQTTIMENIVRGVSPMDRLRHLRDNGYFRHDYGKDERTNCSMANTAQGKKKGVESLYWMLGMRQESSWFKSRMPRDADGCCSNRGSPRIS